MFLKFKRGFRSPGDLVKMQILIEELCRGAHEPACLASDADGVSGITSDL